MCLCACVRARVLPYHDLFIQQYIFHPKCKLYVEYSIKYSGLLKAVSNLLAGRRCNHHTSKWNCRPYLHTLQSSKQPHSLLFQIRFIVAFGCCMMTTLDWSRGCANCCGGYSDCCGEYTDCCGGYADRCGGYAIYLSLTKLQLKKLHIL